MESFRLQKYLEIAQILEKRNCWKNY